MALTLTLLEDDDAILEDDWIRPLEPDDAPVHSLSPYGGRPVNNMKWVRVSDALGSPWYGLTIRTLKREWADIGGFPYEVVRGTMPHGHVWDWRNKDIEKVPL